MRAIKQLELGNVQGETAAQAFNYCSLYRVNTRKQVEKSDKKRCRSGTEKSRG